MNDSNIKKKLLQIEQKMMTKIILWKFKQKDKTLRKIYKIFLPSFFFFLDFFLSFFSTKPPSTQLYIF